MDPRDRLANLGLFGAAAIAWVLVALVVVTRDPLVDPSAGPIGAGLMGIAAGLTCAPLFWLAFFARQRRIAFKGDWLRAGRRGTWAGIIAGVFVLLRLQGALQLPIVLFLVTIVLVAEVTLSTER